VIFVLKTASASVL